MLKRVTKDEFYAHMGPLNVMPQADGTTLRDPLIVSEWRLQNARALVGISKVGIKNSEYYIEVLGEENVE